MAHDDRTYEVKALDDIRNSVGTGVAAAAANTATAAANTAVEIVLAAPDGGKRRAIHQVLLSYSEAPTGGGLTIADGATDVFDLDILAGGPTVLTFDPPLLGTAAVTMTVTLAAGGGTCVGKLNVHAEEVMT